MLRVCRVTLLMFFLSFATAGFADDAKYRATDNTALLEVTLSAQAILEPWQYASRWKVSHSVETMDYSRSWSRLDVKVDFQDSDALARVSRIRNLSLLTFVEFGRARLFLGVDEKGLVGVHLRGFHRVGDERYIEMVRMPYLKQNNDAE